MKNSSSPLLRLHVCSRSDRTSGSGSGGGLKIVSDFFISVSSGSFFTVDKIIGMHAEDYLTPVAGIGNITEQFTFFLKNKRLIKLIYFK